MKFSGTKSIAFWLLLLIAAGVFVLHARIYWNWTEDDAYITYRYAENLARGRGLVFNPGERVEGYSNLSLVLIAAAALRAGRDPVIVAKVVGLAAGLLSLLFSWLLARRIAPAGGLATLLAPFYLAISPFLVRHSVSGLETALFAALLTAGVLLAAEGEGANVPAGGSRTAGAPAPGWREALMHALFLAVVLLLCITRPEGPGFAVLLVIGRMIVRKHRRRTWRGAGAAELAIVVTFIAALLWWRSRYFGALLPNAFYAKVRGGVSGTIDGVQYTLDFLRDSGGPFWAGLALVPVLLGGVAGAYAIALACCVLYLGFVISAGGDWMFHYRFFAHILPVLAACIAGGLGSLFAQTNGWSTRRVPLAACVALLLAATCLSVANTELRVARIVLPAVKEGTYLSQNYAGLGRWFRETTAPDATIAVSDIGAVGYFSDRRIIDMFGLIDRRIARVGGRMHYKADPGYVLSRKPDYIVLVSSGSAGIRPSYLRIPDRVMSEQPEFMSSYELVRTVPLHWQDESVRIYRRR